MDLNEYQDRAMDTAKYPEVFGPTQKLVYPVMGLCGEAGEIMEIVKKIVRNKGGKVGQMTKNRLIRELGDALWYLAAAATEIGVSLNWVAEENLKKLADRYDRIWDGSE